MKTQTFGTYTHSPHLSLYLYSTVMAAPCRAAYKSKRENGTDADNPDWKFPQDGTITWIKGRVEGEYVYGVKDKDGEYEYEVRYDEGTGDSKWMQEKDRRYLARLEKEGRLEKEEPEEFKRLNQSVDCAIGLAEVSVVKKLPKDCVGHIFTFFRVPGKTIDDSRKFGEKIHDGLYRLHNSLTKK